MGWSVETCQRTGHAGTDADPTARGRHGQERGLKQQSLRGLSGRWPESLRKASGLPRKFGFSEACTKYVEIKNPVRFKIQQPYGDRGGKAENFDFLEPASTWKSRVRDNRGSARARPRRPLGLPRFPTPGFQAEHAVWTKQNEAALSGRPPVTGVLFSGDPRGAARVPLPFGQRCRPVPMGDDFPESTAFRSQRATFQLTLFFLQQAPLRGTDIKRSARRGPRRPWQPRCVSADARASRSTRRAATSSLTPVVHFHDRQACERVP